MRLRINCSICCCSRSGSSVALHMKTAMPWSASFCSSASTMGKLNRPKESLVDQAHRHRARTMQALRQIVGPVAELARGLQHLVARLLAQTARCR